MLLLKGLERLYISAKDYRREMLLAMVATMLVAVIGIIGYMGMCITMRMLTLVQHACTPLSVHVSFEYMDDSATTQVSGLLDRSCEDLRCGSVSPADMLTSLQSACPCVEHLQWRILSKREGRLHVVGAVPMYKLSDCERVITREGRLLTAKYFQESSLEQLPSIELAPELYTQDRLLGWVEELLASIAPSVWEHYSMHMQSAEKIVLRPKDESEHWDVIADAKQLMSADMFKRLAAVKEDLIEHQRLEIGQKCVLDVRFADRIVVQPAERGDRDEQKNVA